MKEKVYIYFDEFGNSHLNTDKQGAFSHYVYTAILIKESNLEKARMKREELSKQFFQKRDIKSNRISNDKNGFNKRLKVLDSLNELDFLIYSFVINKSEIDSKGLQFKKSFIKFFQKLFVKKFAQHFTSFEIFADELGHPEFKISLTKFIEENALQRDLFNPDRYYKLANDVSDEKLIQLADFLSGCIGKIYCVSHLHPDAEILFDKLHDRLHVDFFPFQKSYFFANLPENTTELDKKVASISLDLVERYFETYRKQNHHYCEEVLKHLLLYFKVSPDRLVDTRELVSVVKRIDNNYNEQSLRQAIAELRDNGVIVVSIQGRYGYKIPNKLEDIYGFFNRYLNSVIPMLRRVNSVNDLLKMESVNDVNVLYNESEFNTLKELVDIIDTKRNTQ